MVDDNRDDEYPYTGVGEYIAYRGAAYGAQDILDRGSAFYEHMNRRRSVRQFSDRAVSRKAIEHAVMAASTAPSGAHFQPWTFVITEAPAVKAAIRVAAESEERKNYVDGRMPEDWRRDI